MQSILGEGIEPHFSQPPLSMNEPDDFEFAAIKSTRRSAPRRPQARQNLEITTSVNETSEVAPKVSPDQNERIQQRTEMSVDVSYSTIQSPRVNTPSKGSITEGTRGHARNPLEEEQAYLFIGPSRFTGNFDDEETMNQDGGPDFTDDTDTIVVSESPGAIDIDIYERAYQEEIERIKNRSREREAPAPTIYLTRRVEGKSSGLADLIHQATQDKSLSMGDTTSTEGAPSLLNVASKLTSSKSTFTSSTVEGEESHSSAANSGTSSLGSAQTALPLATAAPSKLSATVTTSTTTIENVTASIPHSPPEKSRSGLRSLLDKVRHAR